MADEANKPPPPEKVKVRMSMSMAGDRFSWNVGDVIEVAADEAARLVAAGYAAAVAAEKKSK